MQPHRTDRPAQTPDPATRWVEAVVPPLWRFLRRKKKYGPALMFLSLRLTRPAWGLML